MASEPADSFNCYNSVMELDDIRSRLEALEKGNGRLSTLVAQISETVTIITEVQRRQASVQRTQAGELDALREFVLRHQEFLQRHEEFLQRHEKALADFDVRMKEIGDKLDGLIGYVAGLPKTPPPPPPQ